MLTGSAKRFLCIRLGAGLGIGLALLAAPAVAAVRADDVVATRAYLHADAAEKSAEAAALGGSVAAIEARAGAIAGECPSALLDAPRDAAFGELGEEASSTVFYAGLAPESPLLMRFAQAIGHLSFGNRRLTQLVRGQAAEERAIATLALPNVCGDIAAWKASAYATLPQDARRTLDRFGVLESMASVGPSEEEREAVIQRLLKPYEGPAERETAKRIGHAADEISNRLHAAAKSARSSLAAALGVSAL
jgi:hypothetical protein